MYRVKPSRQEQERKRVEEREAAMSRLRDLDVARGRLEGWSGGRVRPLIEEDN